MNRIGRVAIALMLAGQAACVTLPEGDSLVKTPAVTGGHPVSTLRTACPRIDEQLQDSLRSATYRVGEPGEVRVAFVVRGTRILDDPVLDGSYRYQRYVRRAIEGLECRVDGEDRRFELRVFFVGTWIEY